MGQQATKPNGTKTFPERFPITMIRKLCSLALVLFSSDCSAMRAPHDTSVSEPIDEGVPGSDVQEIEITRDQDGKFGIMFCQLSGAGQTAVLVAPYRDNGVLSPPKHFIYQLTDYKVLNTDAHLAPWTTVRGVEHFLASVEDENQIMIRLCGVGEAYSSKVFKMEILKEDETADQLTPDE